MFQGTYMFKGEQISGAWAMKVSFRRDHLYYDIKDKKELIIQRLGKRIPERVKVAET